MAKYFFRSPGEKPGVLAITTWNKHDVPEGYKRISKRTVQQ